MWDRSWDKFLAPEDRPQRPASLGQPAMDAQLSTQHPANWRGTQFYRGGDVSFEAKNLDPKMQPNRPPAARHAAQSRFPRQLNTAAQMDQRMPALSGGTSLQRLNAEPPTPLMHAAPEIKKPPVLDVPAIGPFASTAFRKRSSSAAPEKLAALEKRPLVQNQSDLSGESQQRACCNGSEKKRPRIAETKQPTPNTTIVAPGSLAVTKEQTIEKEPSSTAKEETVAVSKPIGSEAAQVPVTKPPALTEQENLAIRESHQLLKETHSLLKQSQELLKETRGLKESHESSKLDQSQSAIVEREVPGATAQQEEEPLLEGAVTDPSSKAFFLMDSSTPLLQALCMACSEARLKNRTTESAAA